MASVIDPEHAAWALGVLAPGGTLREARGLHEGGAPWLLRAVAVDGTVVEAVLRVGPSGAPDDIRTEAAALRLAGANGLPVPTVLAIRDDVNPALLLIEHVSGSSEIPLERRSLRLRRLGAFAALLASIVPPPDFVQRTRALSGVDFAQLRREAAPQPLLQRAEAIVDSRVPQVREGLVHGDMWQGNSMWVGDDLTAIIDWDGAGRGPAGIDLGSLRLDAAMCFGFGAARDVLAGWQEVRGREFNLPYWDLVACLSTPPDLDWFVTATQAQGRPDLTRALMRERRDAFLGRALQRIGG